MQCLKANPDFFSNKPSTDAKVGDSVYASFSWNNYLHIYGSDLVTQIY